MEGGATARSQEGTILKEQGPMSSVLATELIHTFSLAEALRDILRSSLKKENTSLVRGKTI